MRMKYFIRGPMLVLLLLLFGTSFHTLKAQVTIGAKTGVNLNQFSQPGTSIGYSIGAFGSYNLTSFLSVKLEPQYSLEGGGRPNYTRNYSEGVLEGVSSVEYVNPTINFHNIQIPLLLELTLPEFAEEAVKPKLILGGSVAFTAVAKDRHTLRYTFVDPLLGDPLPRLDVAYQSEVVSELYKATQLSLWVGLGLDFKAASRTFSFDIRYRQGVNNLNLARGASPGNISGTIGIPGTGGNLYSSSLSFNFSTSIFNF